MSKKELDKLFTVEDGVIKQADANATYNDVQEELQQDIDKNIIALAELLAM